MGEDGAQRQEMRYSIVFDEQQQTSLRSRGESQPQWVVNPESHPRSVFEIQGVQ
jgi:hypothetical protein